MMETKHWISGAKRNGRVLGRQHRRQSWGGGQEQVSIGITSVTLCVLKIEASKKQIKEHVETKPGAHGYVAG